MRIVLDIEANGLKNPSKIWCIVCKDIDTGLFTIFRNLTEDDDELGRWQAYAGNIELCVGHNLIGYDLVHLERLTGVRVDLSCVLDTLILSKLVDYSRPGHSIADYGLEFGLEKIDFSDFSKWSQELETYCIRDVNINHKIYLKYLKVIQDNSWKPSITLEHKFQLLVNDLENNGFSFNTDKANKLLTKVTDSLSVLDADILKAFPPREVLIKEFTPKATKFGTISKSSVPRALAASISDFTVGNTYRHTRQEAFNPASHKQIIAVLNEASWRPVDKTQSHIDTERELARLKWDRSGNSLDTANQKGILELKLEQLRKTGWKVNEANLSTLPEDAPAPARLLAKRILLESRRRTLTEWLNLVSDDDRIHGRFQGIGAWTHRMAHQNPNTANIPSELQMDGSVKLLGKELRQLWQAPKKRLLVGVDAEGIQLRIFAHYIDDPEFTDALVRGKKTDKTDPHSLNQRILGDVCRSRQAAKRFIYALLLGAGMSKLAAILGASAPQTQEALDRLLERYTGFALLKGESIPKDAKRGWFIGLDGRKVSIPGSTAGERRHLCMSGYLQNGEAICMKQAAILWNAALKELGYEYLFVNMVHDEWQTETINDMRVALAIAEIQAESLRITGEQLGLKCPLAGSFFNEDHKDYTIGTNWYSTH